MLVPHQRGEVWSCTLECRYLSPTLLLLSIGYICLPWGASDWWLSNRNALSDLFLPFVLQIAYLLQTVLSLLSSTKKCCKGEVQSIHASTCPPTCLLHLVLLTNISCISGTLKNNKQYPVLPSLLRDATSVVLLRNNGILILSLAQVLLSPFGWEALLVAVPSEVWGEEGIDPHWNAHKCALLPNFPSFKKKKASAPKWHWSMSKLWYCSAQTICYLCRSTFEEESWD